MWDLQCRERDSKQKEELICKFRKINGKNEELVKCIRIVNDLGYITSIQI